ncbi:MAG: AAA family ATPase, partial [Elusimicrobia bacterium]|nr:AAA family ATPase [Elusimicrobiota bacterium]
MRRSLLAAALVSALCAPSQAVVRSVSVVEPGPTGAPAGGVGSFKNPGSGGLSTVTPLKLGLDSALGAAAAPQVKTAPGLVPAAVQPAPVSQVLAPELKAEAPVAEAAPVPAAAQDAAKSLAEAKEKKESAPGLFRRMSRLFDGGRPAPPEPVLADYLQSAPQLPLAPVDLLPAWAKLVSAPVRPQIRFQLDSLEKWGAGAGTVRPITVTEGRAELPAQDVFEAQGLVQKAWSLPAGARQARLVDSKVFYVDAQGRLAVQDRDSGQTKTYQAASGKVERFLVDGSEEVYAVVDKRLERWRLNRLEAVQIAGDDFDAGSIGAMVNKEEDEKGTGFSLYFPGGRVRWSQLGVEKYLGGLRLTKDGSASAGLIPAGAGLYYRVQDGKTTLWKGSNASNEVDELGDMPYAAVSAARVPGRNALVAVTAEGVVQWDLDSHRYRLFRVPGLAEAAARGDLLIQSAADRVFLSAAGRVMELSLPRLDQEVTSADRTRVWSEANPMFVKDGLLHIGDFTFPVTKKAPVPQSWRQRLSVAVKRALGRPVPPQAVLDLGINEKDWQALNLPTNKRLIYDTLKGFTLNQHVLYIGETGGGKTWIADKLAKLTGNELWMVSMNEYTRNKDLIARETFGEEGKNKTGLTMSTVLRWMTEGGVLLLDEMHKPLEGIAVLNNILQNGEYRLPDGRVIKYDKKKSWVIGTMNPVKPPYKGEPPSGEL